MSSRDQCSHGIVSQQIMGTRPAHPNQIYPFNAKNLFFILSLIMFCASTLAFLIFRAKTMLEYGICLFTSLSGLTLLIVVLISIWQTQNIFKMIESCELHIELSESFLCPFFVIKSSNSNSFFILSLRGIGLKNDWISKTVYEEVIERIENMSNLIHFALIKVSLVSFQTIPVLVAMINYLILGKGNESFPDVQFM